MDIAALTVIFSAVGATVLVVSTLLGLGWWLGKQFHHQNMLMYKIRDGIETKLDHVEDSLREQIRAHEKLDDERFNNVNLQLLRLTMLNPNNVA